MSLLPWWAWLLVLIFGPLAGMCVWFVIDCLITLLLFVWSGPLSVMGIGWAKRLYRYVYNLPGPAIMTYTYRNHSDDIKYMLTKPLRILQAKRWKRTQTVQVPNDTGFRL